MRKLGLLASGSLTLISQLAAAQAPPATAPAAPPRAPAAAPATPAAAQPGTTAAPPAPPTAVEEPKLPSVDDPMLEPAPRAAQMVTSWRQALELVRAHSVDVRSAVVRVERARAEARQALSGALPSLTGVAQVGTHILTGERLNAFTGARETVPDPRTGWTAGLELRVPIFHPAEWQAHGTAKDAIDARELNVKDAERRVVAAIADAIVSTVTAERLAEVNRVLLRSALSTLDLNKRRAALGASSQLDVLRAEQDVELTRAGVVSADEQLLRAREALGLALGVSGGYGVSQDIRVENLAADAQTSCRKETSVTARADVKAGSAEVGLAERRTKNIDARLWPVVDAVSNLTVYGSRDSSPTNEYLAWTAGAVLTWNLYDGGQRYAERNALEADVRLSREQLNDTRRRAELEVAQSTRAVQVARTNLTVATRARDIAAETARLAKIAFMNGSGTSFDLVDTARTLRQAELDLAVKEFEVLRAEVTAFLALASCDV
jgi:multidrug efflux system outer membrane protein